MVLSFVYIQAYWVIRERHNGTPELALEVDYLKQKLEREQFQRVLQAEQADRFRIEVATVLPEALKGVAEKEKDYPLRNLASVVASGAKENLQTMVASTLFETGRTLFRQGEYAKANRLFKKLIDSYGFATQVVESHFLMAEGEYLLGNYEGVIDIIGRMVELFPESELTGFGLIRLGQVFEHRERYDEAVQIYRTVLRTFPYRNVASLAQKNLSHMEP